MNILLVTVVTEGRPGILDALPAWLALVVSLALLGVAAAVKQANKKWFKNDSLTADIAALVFAVAGIVGLINALFGS